MLSALFRSTSRATLLHHLFIHPDPDNDYPRALASKMGLSYMPIQKELRSLQRVGILVTRQLGNRLIYQANTSHPLFRELKKLLVRSEAIQLLSQQIPKAIRKSIARLKKLLPGNSQIFLIGVLAKRKIDTIQVWDLGFLAPERLALQKYLDIKQTLHTVSSPCTVDLIDLNRMTQEAQNEVLQQSLSFDFLEKK